MNRRQYFVFAVMLAGYLAPQALLADELVQTDPNDAGLSSVRLERLRSGLNEYVKAGKLPGGVACLSRYY